LSHVCVVDHLLGLRKQQVGNPVALRAGRTNISSGRAGHTEIPEPNYLPLVAGDDLTGGFCRFARM
jgi:hypothetical protein